MPPSADGTVAPDESFEEAAVREPAEETGHPRHRPHHGNRRHPRPPDRCRTGGSGSALDTMSRRHRSCEPHGSTPGAGSPEPAIHPPSPATDLILQATEDRPRATDAPRFIAEQVLDRPRG
ncbi:MAG: NUDIX hydrolase [Nonomuraea sp.]|nr:NUDIX hydrolase [Nonomuraea sp.]